MIVKLWEAIMAFFKEKPYWSVVRPFFYLVLIYLIALVAAYQYIQWQYLFSPKLSLFMRSYVFKQITLVFSVLGIISLIFNIRPKRGERDKQNRLQAYLHKHGKYIVKRGIVASIVILAGAVLFMYYSPKKVDHIRIKFMDEPDIDKYALVYLIYELNNIQKNWFFEIDYDVFNENKLTSEQRNKCVIPRKILCYAEMTAKQQPFIGITTEKLGEDSFWQNAGNVSLISTHNWEHYAPPSSYEYLIYAIIVNSIVLHMNTSCRGIPASAFAESRISHGGLFQFTPRRQAMKAEVLASQLSREYQEALFNCFGAEYFSNCMKLLSMEWLHSEKVSGNLEKCFGVNI